MNPQHIINKVDAWRRRIPRQINKVRSQLTSLAVEQSRLPEQIKEADKRGDETVHNFLQEKLKSFSQEEKRLNKYLHWLQTHPVLLHPRYDQPVPSCK